VPRLTAADGDQVDAVYRESHLLWGSGLGFDEYRGLWRDLSGTAWVRRHAVFHAWVDDDGRLLSSVKLYRPLLRIGELTARATVIGALFTPERLRGRGHATALVEAVLRLARRRGDALVLLFSDIGTAFYEPFGFRALPAVEHWARLPVDPRAPAGWSMRPMRANDLPAVAAAHAAFCAARPLAMLRDRDHWEFLRARAGGFFSRLADPRLVARESVVLDGDRFVGYLATVSGRGEWSVREVGAAAGDVETMASVLRLGALAAREAGLLRMHGWLPPGLAAALPDWSIRERERERARPMIAPLDPSIGLSELMRAEAAYLPFQDQF
jgi:predicted N-acetyltransferase YhbS